MSATSQATGVRCGKWMPRAQEHCARRPGRQAECRTAAALAERRERLTERRVGQTLVTPEVRARWNRKHRLKRMGLTPERFQAMLEAQGHACAMCGTPFGDDRVWIDHDHKCCKPRTPARCCGKCVRGLLCLTCNVAVGYVETYGDLAIAYLASVAADARERVAHVQRR